MARRAVQLAEEKQAHDILLLDIRQVSTIADYFIICSGDNERQLRAIVDHIDERLGIEAQRNARIEGLASTGWILLDYHDIVVHVFHTDQRDYYRLEELWSKATTLLFVQ